MTETLFDVYMRSKEEALELAFEMQSKTCPWDKDILQIGSYTLGTDLQTVYSSGRYTTRKEIATRKYKMGFSSDNRFTFEWQDALHCPKTFKSIPNITGKRMLNGYVKISDLNSNTVYYIIENIFNKTFHADAKVFLECPMQMRIDHSDFIIIKGNEFLKTKVPLTDMVEKFLDHDVKKLSKEKKSDIVHVEEYKGWKISIKDNFNYPTYKFEWNITKGTRIVKDPTSAQNIETSVLWAKERIDYFEDEHNASK